MLTRRMGALLLAFGLLAGSQASAAIPSTPRTDIVIDVGHGGIDGGTSYGKILEKDINLAVGKELFPLLGKKRILTGITRMSDYALSDDRVSKGSRHRRDLAQRVEIANRLAPSIFISLHVNWTSSKAKSGPLVIYRKGHEPSKQVATRLQASLNKLYGVETKPEPGKKYYLLKHTKMPAVIIEMGYMSNSTDRALLTDPGFQKRLAAAIAQALETSLKEDHVAHHPTSRRK
ncbi:N-acetylmuramoyl-L-alanine amidase [Gorillibacterium sp. sgz5001074]|uniref:N-acetylmuramoyl-L-alanine amidase n=1 Tax=Gorillibacterium sp. sgz5001074 TaxID=3446695 RepID=UPI003F67C608